MKIEKVILQNIGVYVNKNEFDLQANKPIILIGGMNGRGKTTFLEAILLSLYGRRALEASQNLEEYLRKISNVTGKLKECFVQIQFSVREQGENVCYTVKRFWDISRKKLVMKTDVWKDGEEKAALSANWDMFVEEILPRAIAPFFFFDGEKIAELAASENDSHMQSSIRALLGIDMIDQLISDLRTVASSNQKKIRENQSMSELEELEDQLRQCGEKIAEKEEEYRNLEDSLRHLRGEKNEIENEYLTVGGDYTEYRKKIKEEQQLLDRQMEEKRAGLLELAASSLPLALVGSLLDEVGKKAKEEKKQRDLQVFLRELPELYQAYLGGKEWGREMEDFFSSVQKQVSEPEDIYDFDSDTIARINDMPAILAKETTQCKALLEEKNNLDVKYEELGNYLAVEIDDEKLRDIQERLSEKSYEIGQAEVKLERISTEQEALKTECENLGKMRKQILERVVREQEVRDENLRIVSYAGMQIEIMKAYRKKIQALKADELAEQMTECFRRIIAKKGLIQKIQIDYDTLKFSYYNQNGQKIDHRMLSSGEKQILVIAMLWALGICSKAEFPLIIDTPLARLDSVHRRSLIENYFPKASEQVIILSTDQEITEKDYQALKKYVGKEYTLVYDTETMSSSIYAGYFGGNLS